MPLPDKQNDCRGFKMTPSDLKYHVEQTGSHFFDSKSLKFFGDTMANYAVSSKPIDVEKYDGTIVQCWELRRKKPVPHMGTKSTYFSCETFERVIPKKD